MAILKNWAAFEKNLLCISITIIIFLTILTKSDWLVTICSISGVIMTLLLAKGKVSGQAIGIATTILYTILAFSQKYYGEIIIYIFIMLPLRIVGIILWLKHQNKKDAVITIRKLDKKEWIWTFFSLTITTFGFYFLLRAFNTNQLIISTGSAVTGVFASYFLAIRNKHGFTFFIINDLVRFILWIIPSIKGNWSLLPIAITCLIYFMNDLYGLYNWQKIEKEQKLSFKCHKKLIF